MSRVRGTSWPLFDRTAVRTPDGADQGVTVSTGLDVPDRAGVPAPGPGRRGGGSARPTTVRLTGRHRVLPADGEHRQPARRRAAASGGGPPRVPRTRPARRLARRTATSRSERHRQTRIRAPPSDGGTGQQGPPPVHADGHAPPRPRRDGSPGTAHGHIHVTNRYFGGSACGRNGTERQDPLSVTLTGGNRHDVTQLTPLAHAVPPIRGRRGPAPPGGRPARPEAVAGSHGARDRRLGPSAVGRVQSNPYSSDQTTGSPSGPRSVRNTVAAPFRGAHGPGAVLQGQREFLSLALARLLKGLLVSRRRMAPVTQGGPLRPGEPGGVRVTGGSAEGLADSGKMPSCSGSCTRAGGSARFLECQLGRRRAWGSRAGFWKELSVGLIVVPGGTISSMRSSTSSVRTTSAAATWV